MRIAFTRFLPRLPVVSVPPAKAWKLEAHVLMNTRIGQQDQAARQARRTAAGFNRQVEGAEPDRFGTPLRLFSSEYERLTHEALAVERRTIVKLRNQDVISDEVLRRIQRDIDLAEARLRQHR
jgi:hypothetical protein